jgi:DNA primase
MPGRIPENILEEILGRVDIVEVISGYIPLKRAGRNFKAPCPFHQEKTPSFMVSPDRQIYHCFGCGESGNAFKFLMRHERMEFPEAVETLAKKAGVVLPETQKEDSAKTGQILNIFKANELTAAFYAQNLQSLENARVKDYLLKRGISEQSIRLFKIGAANIRWDSLINHLKSKNIGLSLMEKAGLILAKDAGGYYDRFRNRAIFPIFDLKSRAIGFGARSLPSAEARDMDTGLPKYVNSPETAVYIKGRNLYGLNWAKDSIREQDCAVVVEGYLDFIIPYQEGLKNIVASLGTALTSDQVRLLKRYSHNIVLVYDGDAAGEMASLRSLDIFIEEDVMVKIAVLPEGFDPDSFVRKFGISRFKELVTTAANLFEYKLSILKSRYDHKDTLGKTKISELMLESISKFKSAVLKSEYIKRLSHDLEIKEEALLQEIKRFATKARPQVHPSIQGEEKTFAIKPAEKLLIRLMLEENSLIDNIRGLLEPDDFQDEAASRIVSVMFDLSQQGRLVEPRTLIDHLAEEDVSRMICESVFLDDITVGDRQKLAGECIRRIKTEKMRSRRQDLHDQIKTAQHIGDEEKLRQLMQEFHELIKKG